LDYDSVDLVDLYELHLDALVTCRGQVLADVIGPDRKLTVAAVSEDGELHPLGAAIFEQRLDRGADRPAGVEDVVDQHARHALEREVEGGRADERLGVAGRLARAHVDVVAVESDVELAERDLGAGELGDAAAQALRERDAARVDADECHALEVGIALDDLVRDPRQRALDRLGVEKGLRFGDRRAVQGALRALLTFDSFPASRDRVKGVCVGAEP
jgi:hypothetical protein